MISNKWTRFTWIAWLLTFQRISINHFYRVLAFLQTEKFDSAFENFHESKYINCCWKWNRTTWTNHMNKGFLLEIKESMNYVRCVVSGELNAKSFISLENHSSSMRGSISIYIISTSVWPASFNACSFLDNRAARMNNIIRWCKRWCEKKENKLWFKKTVVMFCVRNEWI